MRGNRPDMYNLKPKKPTPFVDRKLRFEVKERVTSEGKILTDNLKLASFIVWTRDVSSLISIVLPTIPFVVIIGRFFFMPSLLPRSMVNEENIGPEPRFITFAVLILYMLSSLKLRSSLRYSYHLFFYHP